VEHIEFPNKMDPLLGKITVAYICTFDPFDNELRIVDEYQLKKYNSLPALVFEPPVEERPELLKLLEKGEVGFLVSYESAKELERITGHGPDYIALYGSTGFWDKQLAVIEEYWGYEKRKAMAIAEMFGRHMVALRFFYDATSVMSTLSRYRAGHTSRDVLAREIDLALFEYDAYYDYYPFPDELPLRVTVDVMRFIDEVAVEELLDGDLVKLFELDEPVPIGLKIRFLEVADAVYRALKQVHPRAVEWVGEGVVLVKHLF